MSAEFRPTVEYLLFNECDDTNRCGKGVAPWATTCPCKDKKP
jgi:hypothetical protein